MCVERGKNFSGIPFIEKDIRSSVGIKNLGVCVWENIKTLL